MHRTLLRLLTLPFLVGAALSYGQSGDNFTITNGSETSCSGVLHDSGGTAGTGYSNNEDFTFTLCPDVPGNVIYLTFFTFNLDQSGPNPHDNLTIYDGDNTSSTTLGTYTGTQLQNLIVSGTVFNTTGCLTLVWHSNNTGTGVWACGFQCTTPCEHPNASAVMSEPVPALVCQGEQVLFDGTSSSAAPGFNLVQYLWDFHDGSVDSTSGPIVTHAFADPGEHIVQLHLTDDNGCKSLNLVDLQVLVSTTPDFAGTSPSSSTCFGETVNLTGVATPVTWTGIPDANFGNGVYLPDDVGQPFTSELTFQQFGAGQTLTSTSDIESICVDMEHSFMGDLVLQVICPNGQTVIFHQQGGSGTYLGSPYDGDSDTNPEQGECWHYCWSPTATNGTWVDNSTVGGTPNTLPSGMDNPGQALAPGTYESVQPFSNLIGCPLNGTWTYQSTDLWGADNGFICGWQINFNPNIIPPATTFTPSFGLDADSTYWTTNGLGTLSSNADTVHYTATAPGTYPFTYNVMDNFGCHYDTTINITFDPPFTVEAGPDQTICNDPVQLLASIINGQGSPMVWSWTPTAGLSNPNIINPTAQVTSQTTYTVSAHIVGHPACNGSDSLTISLDPGLDPGLDTAIVVCASSPDFQLMDMLGGTPVSGGVWTDANGNPANTTFHPFTDASQVFTYTVTTALGCVGTAHLDITVLPLSDPSCCGIIDAGPDSVICSLTYHLHATIANPGDGVWSGPSDVIFSNAQSPSSAVTAAGSGARWLYWTEDDGVHCHLVDSVKVTFTEPLVMQMTTTDAICFQSCDGTASVAVTGGNGGYRFQWSDALADSTSSSAAAICAGNYQLMVSDTNSCSASEGFQIGQPVLLEIDSVSFVEPWCHGDCNGTVTIHDHEAVAYSFDAGTTYGPDPARTASCAGPYDLAIRDAAGCIGTLHVTLEEPPQVVADYTHLPEPANVNDPVIHFHNTSQNAVTYSWDIAGLLTTQEADPSYRFTDKYPDTYPVCLIAYDDHGCTDTTCQDIIIHDVLFTYVPNSFTPDGDGHNDTWMMSSNIADIAEFQMQVFDRWGEVVFASNDPLVAWNGGKNNGGSVMKEDVYAYRITFRIISTRGTRELMGHVTLLK